VSATLVYCIKHSLRTFLIQSGVRGITTLFDHCILSHILIQFFSIFFVLPNAVFINSYILNMKRHSCDTLILVTYQFHIFVSPFCQQVWMKRTDNRMLTCSCLDDTRWKCMAGDLAFIFYFLINCTHARTLH
jgi:hypothetical protein